MGPKPETTQSGQLFGYPLLERCRTHLVKEAQQCGLTLRQNYNREAPRLAWQVGRYAHARQTTIFWRPIVCSWLHRISLVTRVGRAGILAQEGIVRFLFIQQSINLLLDVHEEFYSKVDLNLLQENMREYEVHWQLVPIDTLTPESYIRRG